jgi:hypothetical protein
MATRAPLAATAPASARTARATVELEDAWANHEFAQQLLQRAAPNLSRVAERKTLACWATFQLRLLHS